MIIAMLNIKSKKIIINYMRNSKRRRRTLSQGRDKYTKITHKGRTMLLKRILCDHSEIIQSSKDLGINYSTAKTFMRKFKHKGLKFDLSVLERINGWYQAYDVERQRCGYTTIEPPTTCKIEDLPCQYKEGDETEQAGLKMHLDNNMERCQSKATSVQIYQIVLFRA